MKKIITSLKALIIVSIVINILMGPGCANSDQKPDTADKNNTLSGNISISGAFALYPLTVRWAEEFQKLYPEVRIDISAGGAGKGMTDVLSGMVDLGMFSRSVSQAEKEKGAWWIGVAKDGVLCTINSKNPVMDDLKTRGLTLGIFQDIFLQSKFQNWGECVGNDNMDNMNIYTRSDACGAAQKWGEYLGKDQESLRGVGVFGDPGMADAIKKDKKGIGYNNIIFIYDMNTRLKYENLEVVPIDLNENGEIDSEEDFYNNLDNIMQAINEEKYPSPPARELYFVANGKPGKKVVQAFLKWILSEGQQYVNESGYVKLSGNKIKLELEKL